MTSNDYLEDDRPIAQEDIAALVASLGNINIRQDVDLQPILKALEKQHLAQVASQKEIASLQKAIDLQLGEIKELKKQDNTRWLQQYLNKATIFGTAALLSLAIALPLVLLHLFIPAKLDSDTLEKRNFLYLKEAERLPKTKKSTK